MSDVAITGEQIRAARALLRIEQKQLANEARLSLETIKRLEAIRGPVDANPRTLRALRAAFFRLGAVFDSRHAVGEIVGARRGESEACAQIHEIEPQQVAANGEPLLRRLIYSSTARARTEDGAGGDVLTEIAASSLRRNQALKITGALLRCNGFFLQVLEGPAPSVEQVYRSIQGDDRHCGLTLVQDRAVQKRIFDHWTMLTGDLSAHDPIIVEDLGMRDGFSPGSLMPVEALGLLMLVVLAADFELAQGDDCARLIR